MKVKLSSCSLVLLACLLSCEEPFVNDGLLLQNSIIVDGDWDLHKVYQNEVDITDKINLNSFVLTLNYEGEQPSTYSITSDRRFPFFTGDISGQWSFDDGIFPSEMYFITDDTASAELASPLQPENNSSLELSFNLGCSENNYVFKFGKELAQ